ncbi:MAG TPA: UbiA family prenyltransferase [Gemmataceae bacterium]|jgi:4-hydroxybenzoate polyprenyltransferase|nr:UbiA family prenyltransferase [Gemmataceae bacterium]
MRFLPLARLLRLPNVFTAFADIALGLCATYALSPSVVDDGFWWKAALLLVASGCLYTAGMVWNDYFDLAEDKRDRPFRPLPSGRISVRTAVAIGTLLLLGGWACAAATGKTGSIVGGALAAAILAYDARIKRTSAGPFGMALCRFLNVLLGLSLADGAALPVATRVHLALTVGVYIVGVTWFARTEEKRSDPKVLTKAALVMLAAALLALAAATRVPPGTSSPLFPYLLVAWGFWVGGPVVAAVRKPTPDRVQAGVKRAIFGLVGLDALLASVFVGTPGFLLILLLPPALLLGKWVYST